MSLLYEKKGVSLILRAAVLFFAFITFCTSCSKPESRPGNSDGDTTVIPPPPPGPKPNIILILADDIGYDALSSHGNQTFQTPRLDEMVRNGMDFTHCYGSPLCSPSRFMFVSGKYNFRNYNEWGIMDPNEKTFANLAHDAGYATYVAGKWQFGGGDASIHAFGYDDYSIWDPDKDVQAGSHYKDPRIYENGAFLPDSVTVGTYGEDFFTNRVLSFVNKNKSNPFFVFYPMALCHFPYSPTPDDPEYATWQNNSADTAFFPSMVKYMDKKVGQIIDSLRAWDLYNNTIVIFSGDNGTPEHIFYYVNGVLKEGTKSASTAAGTNVPLVVTWPAKIAGGQINRNLVDFTDLLPTVADAAQTHIPGSYGIIDGVSFYNQLAGVSYKPRSWVFCHFAPNTNSGNTTLQRWIQDTTYKAYDSSKKIFNIITDPDEKDPINYRHMTSQQQDIYRNFQSIMDTLH